MDEPDSRGLKRRKGGVEPFCSKKRFPGVWLSRMSIYTRPHLEGLCMCEGTLFKGNESSRHALVRDMHQTSPEGWVRSKVTGKLQGKSTVGASGLGL